MNIILLGPPGSGKGTQGALLAEHLGIVKISTGDLLRDAMRAGTTLGKRAKAYYDKGELVPDDVILGLIEEILARPEARRGMIMDGFPRTVGQAEAVDRLLATRDAALDAVLNFVVPEDELIRRLSSRSEEQGRADDAPEAIRKRLKVYEDQTAPLEEYYRERNLLRNIPGTGEIDTIFERVRRAVTS